MDEHSDAEMTDQGKIRCVTTGHEMPARLALLTEHWGAKRYKNCKAQAQYDFAQHEPWIVAHKKSPHLLYCMLTKQPLSKQQKTVEGHVKGKRYKQLLAKALNPTESKLKKRSREQADDEGGSDWEDLEDDDEAGGEDDGGMVGGEDEDKFWKGGIGPEDDDDENAAAEWLEEGPFWERDEDVGDDEEASDEEATLEGTGVVSPIQSGGASAMSWTRPTIEVGDAGNGGKSTKKASAGAERHGKDTDASSSDAGKVQSAKAQGRKERRELHAKGATMPQKRGKTTKK